MKAAQEAKRQPHRTPETTPQGHADTAPAEPFRWTRRHLLGIEDLSTEEIEHVLATAQSFKEVSTRDIKKVPALRGKTVVNLFYEASTRTRTSFEIAAKRLSADVLGITTSTSSVVKGETLVDTVHNLEAFQIDILVIRHSASGAPHFLARHARASVVNAGDGLHEHPTQALLDCFTIREHKKSLSGLRIVIVGDIYHSRVARSDIFAFSRLGAHITLCGPPTLLPAQFADLGVRLSTSLDEAIEGADVIYALRMQLERQQANFLPSVAEYVRLFGLTTQRLERAKPDAIIMHPGPVNRGIELTAEVADSARSVILEQTTNGIAVRMAVLFLLAGARG